MTIGVLIGITVLFFILLGIKQVLNKRLKKEFCVICLAVSLIWIFLLALLLIGYFNDKIIISILMGQSSLGLFYFLDSRIKRKEKEQFKIFKLPLLLTFIFVIYSILGEFYFNSFYFLFVLWLIFFGIYLFKNNRRMNVFAKKLMECCKRW